MSEEPDAPIPPFKLESNHEDIGGELVDIEDDVYAIDSIPMSEYYNSTFSHVNHYGCDAATYFNVEI